MSLYFDFVKNTDDDYGCLAIKECGEVGDGVFKHWYMSEAIAGFHIHSSRSKSILLKTNEFIKANKLNTREEFLELMPLYKLQVLSLTI